MCGGFRAMRRLRASEGVKLLRSCTRCRSLRSLGGLLELVSHSQRTLPGSSARYAPLSHGWRRAPLHVSDGCPRAAGGPAEAGRRAGGAAGSPRPACVPARSGARVMMIEIRIPDGSAVGRRPRCSSQRGRSTDGGHRLDTRSRALGVQAVKGRSSRSDAEYRVRYGAPLTAGTEGAILTSDRGDARYPRSRRGGDQCQT